MSSSSKKTRLSAKAKDLLIDVVQRYPFLWDVKHVDFRNPEKKEATWQDVTKELREEEDDIDYAAVKTTWKSIRDQYRKVRRKRPDLMHDDLSTRWKRLYFLDDVLENTENFKGVDDELEDGLLVPKQSPGSSFEGDDKYADDQINVMLLPLVKDLELPTSSSNSQPDVPNPKGNQRKRPHSYQCDAAEFPDKRSQPMNTESQDNTIDLWIHSLAAEIKKVAAKDRRAAISLRRDIQNRVWDALEALDF